MLEIAPPITNVTLYSDRAQVTRFGAITLPAGAQTLVIPAIARTANTETLQIIIPHAQIISVETQPQYEVIPHQKEAVETEYARLCAELDTIELELQLVAQHLSQLNILSRTLNQTLGTALVEGTKTSHEAAVLTDALQASYRTHFLQQRDLGRQREDLQKKLDPLRKQLDLYLKQPIKDRRLSAYQVLVHLLVEAAVETSVTAVYFVEDVKWKPDYICHLREKRVLLKYGAFIYQNTGEDWPPLQLRLSTAELGTKPQIPHALPWAIGVFTPEVQPKNVARQPDHDMSIYTTHTTSSMPERPRAVAKQPAAPAEDQLDIEDFQTAQAIAITSQPQFVQTVLFDLELPALYDHVAVPKVDNRVMQRAKIINASPYTLVAAPVTIQENGSVVSKTNMPRTVSGENLEFALRLEDRIKLRRRLVERKHSILEDGQRQIFYRYSIIAHNYRDVPVKITLRDVLPLAQHEDIQVQLGQVSPEPLSITEHNILKWVLDVLAQTEQTVTYEFTVVTPRGLILTGIE